MKELFFSPNFEADFTWKGHDLRVGSLRPEYKRQIADGLKDMSSTSIRNRFMGSKKEFTDKELEYLTSLDGWNHYALGLVEQATPHKGVAVVRMVRSSERPEEAEVAITLIDKYQQLGLGTFLMNLMLLAAREREISRFSFTFMAENEGIRRLVRKIGPPMVRNHGQDSVQETVELSGLSVEELKSRLAKTLPVIENFHLKT